jgi:hypothetical protein
MSAEGEGEDWIWWGVRGGTDRLALLTSSTTPTSLSSRRFLACKAFFLTNSWEMRLPDFVRTNVWPATDALTGVVLEVDVEAAAAVAADPEAGAVDDDSAGEDKGRKRAERKTKEYMKHRSPNLKSRH